jgi:hypothetical protein
LQRNGFTACSSGRPADVPVGTANTTADQCAYMHTFHMVAHAQHWPQRTTSWKCVLVWHAGGRGAKAYRMAQKGSGPVDCKAAPGAGAAGHRLTGAGLFSMLEPHSLVAGKRCNVSCSLMAALRG